MRIKDLKLGIRLGVAFGLLLLITMVIAVLGVMSVTALQHSNEHIATSELKRQGIVHQWQTDIQMNWLRTEAFPKANDAQYAGKLKKDMSAVVEVQSKRMQEVRNSGRTLFYVSHAAASVRKMCDRVIVLEDGKVGFDGDVDAGIRYLHYDDDDPTDDEAIGADI